MSLNLQGKKVVLGVSGGIASYKSVSLARLLIKAGVSVTTVMTTAATKFVQPLTFQTITGRPVFYDMFNDDFQENIGHIKVPEQADCFIIAPATANIIAKIACGLADDFLSTSVLANNSPLYLAPAMNTNMWNKAIVQENIEKLKARGISIIPPTSGLLACQTVGLGKMAEPESIVKFLVKNPEFQSNSNNGLLNGIKVLVTAGPTREKIDAVRYISNYSSGKMGFAIAEYCLSQGAKVTLVSGPVALMPPEGINFISVQSADEMFEAVMANAPQNSLIIKSAAVSDYKIEKPDPGKNKKRVNLKLNLIQNRDILKTLGKQKSKNQYLVGFAAESENLEAYARKKLLDKQLDLIVANNILEPGAGFDGDTNIVSLINATDVLQLPQQSKFMVAEKIIQKIVSDPKWAQIKNYNP
ncbi:MAG: bifunctional phosphopantothenoylcysteine decarboxylase/phosphopantothenate--cysteine ligase CoaBC [Deltaproteobacteria bacterium]|nr:bifunctional phosphopantothenoylcysteine decarboxylase/phosphopantothenate--cysteine ligase CoaBC [Deltaproteobacteria bacterium]MBT4525117.1 bifunctional phosphopantothenoylcysteine decarboxylase/phosphopantothenate--cysteine ligase CoaBC [Deltaproteobacteria bacterium]